jgi:tryptophan synthase beta chain
MSFELFIARRYLSAKRKQAFVSVITFISVLGIAIGEACEDAFSRDDTHYSLGSVVNHVLLHQTVIGLESKKQLEKIGVYPDIIVGCIGGGSNFAGMFLPFVKDKIEKKKPKTQIICVEPTACPSITKGVYAWDYGDVAGMAPIA